MVNLLNTVKIRNAMRLVIAFAAFSSSIFASQKDSSQNYNSCGRGDAMLLDSSNSYLVTKYSRIHRVAIKDNSKMFTIFKNNEIALKSDSISIISDLQDELACSENMESSYSKGVQRMLNNFVGNGKFIPKQKFDSVAIEMLLISLADRELLESDRPKNDSRYDQGFSLETNGFSSNCSPKGCYTPIFAYLRIDGEKKTIKRKHHDE